MSNAARKGEAKTRQEAMARAVMATGLLGGYNLVCDDTLIQKVEDWSKARSPSRAKRRAKKGHPQNVVVSYVPSPYLTVIDEEKTVRAHPETITKMAARFNPLFADSTLLLNDHLKPKPVRGKRTLN